MTDIDFGSILSSLNSQQLEEYIQMADEEDNQTNYNWTFDNYDPSEEYGNYDPDSYSELGLVGSPDLGPPPSGNNLPFMGIGDSLGHSNSLSTITQAGQIQGH